jgi:hypothetical protein
VPWQECAKAQGLPPRADGSPALFDFARARNLSVSLAMQHSHDPANDWLVEVDSNWELMGPVHRVRPALESAPAEVTGYEVMVNEVGASTIPYLRFRRVRECGPRGWRWYFPIHEYIFRPDNAAVGRFEGVYVRHEATAGSRANRQKRFERDEVILRELIADLEAQNVAGRPQTDHERGHLTRAWYYLGQTLSNMGREDEAYTAFETRAKLQGGVPEWSSACYRAGRLAAKRKDYASARRWFLEAYAVGGGPEGLWGYSEVSSVTNDFAAATASAFMAYDVAKTTAKAGFSYVDSYALSTPGPARDHATIAARIKQLGLLGVPYPNSDVDSA